MITIFREVASKVMQNHTVARKIKGYSELIMFRHSLFSLPFGVCATVLSTNRFSFDVILCIIGLFLARSGANAFNRFADRRYDSQNARTTGRNIPMGNVSPLEALIITGICFILLAVVAVLLGPVTTLGYPIAITMFMLYSYSKRFTPYCHILLGLCCGLGVPACSLALTGKISVTIFIMYLAVAFKITSHDILYAISDIDFDRVTGLYSYPAVYGEYLSRQSAMLFEFSSLILFTFLYFTAGMSFIYVIGLFSVTLISSISFHGGGNLVKKSYDNNAVTSCILSVLMCIDLLMR